MIIVKVRVEGEIILEGHISENTQGAKFSRTLPMEPLSPPLIKKKEWMWNEFQFTKITLCSGGAKKLFLRQLYKK